MRKSQLTNSKGARLYCNLVMPTQYFFKTTLWLIVGHINNISVNRSDFVIYFKHNSLLLIFVFLKSDIDLQVHSFIFTLLTYGQTPSYTVLAKNLLTPLSYKMECFSLPLAPKLLLCNMTQRLVFSSTCTVISKYLAVTQESPPFHFVT